MASQSLYRKWRSQTFSDLVGQEAIVRTLKNALTSGNPAHAYLFTGPRGTGKTTTARLLAKTVNCLQPKNGEPCNECQLCREITAGNSFNVIEIDAASNRGIDSIRELREKVMVPPATGKYKVYILDEAHMLTTEAFNALLKTLEEPPRHAIFVMATTDVHKMLPTVLSRCQRFDFKRFTMRQIVEHLNFVAEQEHIKLERGAAELIARAAAGGMRDALSLLDQATAYCGEEIGLAQVQAMLGVADPRAIQKLIQHVASLDSPAGLHLIHELAESGADLRQINAQVAEFWRALMLAKAGADVATILDRTEDEVREIFQMTPLFGLEELTECARIFAQNELMQKNQGTPQLGLELALLACIELHRRAQHGRVTTSSPAATVQSVLPAQSKPVHTLPVQEPPRPTVPPTPARPPLSAEGETRIHPAAPTPPPSSPQIVSSHKNEESANELPDWDEVSFVDDYMEPESSLLHSAEPIVEASAKSEDVTVPDVQEVSNAPSLTIQQVKDKWELIKRRIKTKKDGGKIAPLLNDFTAFAVEGTAELPVVVIRAAHDWHYKTLAEKERLEYVEWAMKLEFGMECRVRLVPPGQPIPSISLPPPLTLPHDTKNRSANTTITGTPQQSAYRERPAALPEAMPSPPQKSNNAEILQRRGGAEPKAPPTSVSYENSTPPLAKTNTVRENTTKRAMSSAGESRQTQQESLKQKAVSDPVVQEVVRLFKAEIKDIHQK
ncbi:MAG TPA: DNA polymerase III subunit gamma/tau [Ktedonobacteraceae bacterium]|nr:DNA polymerase III subunit gamma/tau [Ktedonobacteraceae bacterium]